MENNEMTEMKMIEFAAKAMFGEFADQMISTGWSSLDNDGDAMRLAVKLGIGFRHRTGGDGSTYPDLVTVFTGSFDLTEYVSQSGDAFSATRLAITKAAAEIGKRMA